MQSPQPNDPLVVKAKDDSEKIETAREGFTLARDALETVDEVDACLEIKEDTSEADIESSLGDSDAGDTDSESGDYSKRDSALESTSDQCSTSDGNDEKLENPETDSGRYFFLFLTTRSFRGVIVLTSSFVRFVTIFRHLFIPIILESK